MKLLTALLPLLIVAAHAGNSDKTQMKADIAKLKDLLEDLTQVVEDVEGELNDLIKVVEGNGADTNSHADRLDDLEETMKIHNLGTYGDLNHAHD